MDAAAVVFVVIGVCIFLVAGATRDGERLLARGGVGEVLGQQNYEKE